MKYLINQIMDSHYFFIDIKENQKIIASNQLILECAKVFAEAFENYPLFTYYFPMHQNRLEKLSYLHKILLCYNLHNGFVNIFQEKGIIKGVLMDIILSEWKVNTFEMIKCNASFLPLKLGIAFLKKQKIMEEIMNTDHNTITNHQQHSYLWAIGVKPAFQGEGIGKKLILYYKERNQNRLQYLETMDQKNIAIYSKYGFHLVKSSKTPIKNLVNFCMITNQKSKTRVKK